MSRRLRKPQSPEQIAALRAARIAAERARDFAAVGLQPEAARLAANSNIEVRRTGAQHVESARRVDAFDALRDGMAPGAYDAVRRLETDMIVRRGEAASGGRTLMRIDCNGGGAGPDGGAVQRLDRARSAATRIDAALARVGARDALLLCELIQPNQPGRTWRETVRAVTGEENPVAQGAVVRAACINLAMGYGR